MINVLKIKGRIREKNFTQEYLASKLGMSPSTLNYKINNKNGGFLTIEEVDKLKNILEIPNNELSDYFFVNQLEKTQESELEIPKWLNERLAEQSKITGLSKNSLISLAIREYLEKNQKDESEEVNE